MINSIIRAPFFIIGSPRSGTTLLEVILDGHNDVAVCPEIFTGRLLDRFNLTEKINDRWKSLFLLNSQYRLSQPFLDPVSECLAKQALREFHFPITSSEWYRLFIQDYLQTKNASIFGEKTPENTLYLKNLQIAFPRAKYIIIIRNPIDTILSMCESANLKLNRPINTAFLLRFATIVKRGLRELYVNKRLCNQDSYSIKYEDLVVNPVDSIKKICGFLSIDFQQSMLNFQQRKKFVPGFELVQKIHCRLNQPFVTDRINRSSSVLTKEQIYLLYEYLLPEITFLPYKYTFDYSPISSRNKLRIRLAKFSFSLHLYKIEEFKNKIRFKLHYFAIRLLHNTPLKSFLFKNIIYKKEQWEAIIAKAQAT